MITSPNDVPWNSVADVVVVGSGAAALSAAVTAAAHGPSVTVLERCSTIGGTTAKSSGGMWVPNNPVMQEEGLADPRPEALAYMARVSYPARFDAASPTLGLDALELELLESVYDHGAEALQFLCDQGALFINRERGHPYPDYHSDLPQDVAPFGRALAPAMPPGETMPPELATNPSLVGGSILIETLRRAAVARSVTILTDHRVMHVHKDDHGAVIGIEAHAGHGRGTVLVGAKRGVVFGSGGFLHDPELRHAFLRGALLGGCAAAGSTGDFVRIGIETGAALGNMTEAWWTQTPLEMVLRTPETAEDVFFPFGDSMVHVNKYGRRVMDEKQTYNDRGPVHFAWDAGRREFPNLVLFQIYDDAVATKISPPVFRSHVPQPGIDVDYVISADTLEGLASEIDARLAQLEHATGGLRLDPCFTPNLHETVARFSDSARRGIDEDFGRGEKPIQQAWQRWQGEPRPGLANPCIAPFAEHGPYHCIMLVAAALDTKGGPRIDGSARILGVGGAAIPGLYGAGNCVASPAGAGYWGGGGTIGPALTFGYLAGCCAAAEPDRW